MTDAQRRALLYVVIAALVGVVLCVAFAAIASAQQCMCPAPVEPPVVVSPLRTPQPWSAWVWLPQVTQ